MTSFTTDNIIHINKCCGKGVFVVRAAATRGTASTMCFCVMVFTRLLSIKMVAAFISSTRYLMALKRATSHTDFFGMYYYDYVFNWQGSFWYTYATCACSWTEHYPGDQRGLRGQHVFIKPGSWDSAGRSTASSGWSPFPWTPCWCRLGGMG